MSFNQEVLTWVTTQMNSKQIKNLTVEKCILKFGLSIQLEHYLLVSIAKCKNTGNKRCVFFKIQSCSNKVFGGRHVFEIYIGGNESKIIKEYKNIPDFKKDFFVDALPFERFSFIILENEQKLVRVQSIRPICSLPNTSNPVKRMYFNNKTFNQNKTSHLFRKKITKIIYDALIQSPSSKNIYEHSLVVYPN